MNLHQTLKNRWDTLGQTLGLSTEKLESEWIRLQSAYAAPGRHYHNLKHLSELFGLLEEVAQKLEQPDEVALAVWYHDVVYDPTRQDNEVQSAVWARETLNIWGLAEEKINLICQHIEATAGHQVHSEEPDQAYFLDADLAILGSTRDKYEAYTQQIRQEYAIFPDMLYKPGRKQVLEKILEKPHLYFTSHFQDRFEAQARENLQWEIQYLGQ